uniref:Endonuclease/exonuclease/phosphatase family protein n=1 Tax=Haemonchus contortus TaxID=6289 RepID=A0A7I4YQ16_HAECO
MLDYIKQVFITGDASCIGKKDDDLRRWSAEVAKEIAEQKPEFAVVHVQGLHSADDPDYMSRVILGGIIDTPEIHKHFDSSIAFFDTTVTGLGNLYLFRDHSAVQQFDRFLNTGYRQIRAGHDAVVGRSEADGFIRNTFGEQPVTSRRLFYREDGTRDISQQRTGFLLTRFRIHGKEMTFVNLNLHSVPFEDVNEIVEQVQVTKAARKRNEEIEMLLKELEAEGLRDDAIIVGGAFNAQLHETDLLTYLAKTQMVQTIAKKDNSGKVEAIQQYDRHGRNVTTVERQRFDLHSIHDWFFRLGRGQMVKKYNGELAPVTFKGQLKEQSVFFQPSRHYAINEHTGKEEFMRTLCPAWADRVLYNEKMDKLFRYDSFCASGLYYGLVGENVYIGQHKPVALHATICLK